MRKGFGKAIGAVLFIAAALTFSAGAVLGPPPPELLWVLSQAGIGLLIAYSIAIASAEKDLGHKGTRERHESWIGFVSGCGVCGLAGIGVALLTASHREAGHSTFVDKAGLWWSVCSIGMLGIVVAILPTMSYEWRKGRPLG